MVRNLMLGVGKSLLIGSFPMRNECPADEKTKLTTVHQGRAVHVLVVDDNPDIVASMALLLRLYGHKVDTALGGSAALATAQANRPDVVLLDISMPGMSGYEVARRLRSMFGGGVTLIAITAHGFEEDRRRCLEAGFDCHFVKPADPEKVEEFLRELARLL